MVSDADEPKKIQAEFALGQLAQKERLIKEAKKRWFPMEYVGMLLWLAVTFAMYWATRREWSSADTTLLLMISGTMGYGTIGIHKRIDALIRLLELEGLFKVSQTNTETGQA